mgnify:CR=1 FL=1
MLCQLSVGMMIQKTDNSMILFHFLNSLQEYMIVEKQLQSLFRIIRLNLIEQIKCVLQLLINRKELKESKKKEQKKLRSKDNFRFKRNLRRNNRMNFKNRKFN